MPNDSLFLKYENILLNQGYSNACSLQDFVLSCYNGCMGQFQGSSLRNFDSHHFRIFLRMVKHYYDHGENDPHFLTVGSAIWKNRRARGCRLLAEIAKHQSIKPSEYRLWASTVAVVVPSPATSADL